MLSRPAWGVAGIVFASFLIIAPAYAHTTSDAYRLLSSADQENEVSNAQICKAGIATLMGRDPEIMKTDGYSGDVIFISYVRKDDKSRWAYKCKIDGNRIIWGSESGRWRIHPADSKTVFEIRDGRIYVEDIFDDGSSTKKSFKLKNIPQ